VTTEEETAVITGRAGIIGTNDLLPKHVMENNDTGASLLVLQRLPTLRRRKESKHTLFPFASLQYELALSYLEFLRS
jgi:hypothetical protein